MWHRHSCLCSCSRTNVARAVCAASAAGTCGSCGVSRNRCGTDTLVCARAPARMWHGQSVPHRLPVLAEVVECHGIDVAQTLLSVLRASRTNVARAVCVTSAAGTCRSCGVSRNRCGTDTLVCAPCVPHEFGTGSLCHIGCGYLRKLWSVTESMWHRHSCLCSCSRTNVTRALLPVRPFTSLHASPTPSFNPRPPKPGIFVSTPHEAGANRVVAHVLELRQ